MRPQLLSLVENPKLVRRSGWNHLNVKVQPLSPLPTPSNVVFERRISDVDGPSEKHTAFLRFPQIEVVGHRLRIDRWIQPILCRRISRCCKLGTMTSGWASVLKRCRPDDGVSREWAKVRVTLLSIGGRRDQGC